MSNIYAELVRTVRLQWALELGSGNYRCPWMHLLWSCILAACATIFFSPYASELPVSDAGRTVDELTREVSTTCKIASKVIKSSMRTRKSQQCRE